MCSLFTTDNRQLSTDVERVVQSIFSVIFDRSVVGFEYSGLKTFTAEETFDKRTGNCLSYTTMFIAMARYAGLIAKFQEVSDFSDWNRQGNLIVFSSHNVMPPSSFTYV